MEQPNITYVSGKRLTLHGGHFDYTVQHAGVLIGRLETLADGSMVVTPIRSTPKASFEQGEYRARFLNEARALAYLLDLAQEWM